MAYEVPAHYETYIYSYPGFLFACKRQQLFANHHAKLEVGRAKESVAGNREKYQLPFPVQRAENQ